MVGNLTFDKANMNISYFLYTIKIIYDNGGIIERSEFVQKMASFIGVEAKKDGKENRTPYNKSKLPRYFGFVDLQENNDARNLVLTKRGVEIYQYISDKGTEIEPANRYFIEKKNRDKFVDVFFESVLFDSFGKNNCGAEQSNTDIEPPKIIFKTIFELGKATAEEICYVIFGLNKCVFSSFEAAINTIKRNRNLGKYNYSKIMETWNVANIVKDCKIINIFTDESLNLLLVDKDKTLGKDFYYLNSRVKEKYNAEIQKLYPTYQPIQMIVYTTADINKASIWLNTTILGRVSNDDNIFKINIRSKECNLFWDIDENGNSKPGILTEAIEHALRYEKENVFLIIENASFKDIVDIFGEFSILLRRENNFQLEQNGWSKEGIYVSNVFEYLLAQLGKKIMNDNERKIKIPSNLHLIGTLEVSEKMAKLTNYDYNFKTCFVDEDINNVTNEKLFKMWLVNAKKKTGEPYTRNAMTQYTSAIKAAKSVLLIDFYKVDSIVEYDEKVPAILNKPEFTEFNNKRGNGALSAGLALYRKFLVAKEKLDNETVDSEIGYLTPEWFRQKATAYTEFANQCKEQYKEFNEKYGVDILKTLEGRNLLRTMFLSDVENRDNISYALEFKQPWRDNFGSIVGGNSYKYDLFYHKQQHRWVIGSHSKPKELTEQKAIELGVHIRDALIMGVEVIKNLDPTTKEEYIVLSKKLHEKMGKYVDSVVYLKYLHMTCPSYFPTCYSENWQNYILCRIGIVPDDDRIVKMGQISLFVKECGIPNVVFAKICYDEFGHNVKSLYRVGAGHDSNNFFEEWYQNDYVAIGWNYLGNLQDLLDDEGKLDKEIVCETLMDKGLNRQVASRKFGEINNFLQLGKGNFIVAMHGNDVLGIAELIGDYYYDYKRPYSHCRDVRWIKKLNPVGKLPIKEGHLTSFFEISAFENLCYLYRVMIEQNEVREIEFMENEDQTVLVDRKSRTIKTHNFNTILYGAPGTGKTYATAEYALAICENREVRQKITKQERETMMAEYRNLQKANRIVFTTFHQSYGYEDFIQGLRPDTKSETMKFLSVDGIFKKIADKAIQDQENNYVVIIDEINRGNISKIFGELITLIEDDKRWGESNQLSVTLPSGDEFAVPNNLYIIGTMNSADKSISLIDIALRRRFFFIEQAPDYSLIDDVILKDILQKLNNNIKNELRSTDLLIGHAFFIGRTIADLKDIMNGQIIPLLYEYFYDDASRIVKVLDCLKDTNFVVDDEYQGRIIIKEKVD